MNYTYTNGVKYATQSDNIQQNAKRFDSDVFEVSGTVVVMLVMQFKYTDC